MEAQRLLRLIPLDGGDDPAAREQAILALRRHVASRWKTVLPGAFQGTDEERMSAAQGYKAELESFAETHGTDTPFAPHPHLTQAPTLQDETCQEVSEEQVAERPCPDHSFRFLQTTCGVWTLIQAGLCGQGIA